MANLDFIAPTGKFEDWNVYKLSLIIVDITDLFIKTYLDKYRDQSTRWFRLRVVVNKILLKGL